MEAPFEFGWIKVTKLDAARRQLRTAIELWFQDGDPVAIHTLAYAAHEIIHRLFRRKGLTGLLFDAPGLKEENRKKFANILKADANFFKHAERESKPDDVREFSPDVNESFITICLFGLERMDEEHDDAGLAFKFWFRIHKPEMFYGEAFQDSVPVEKLKKWKRFNKSDFFRRYVELREIARRK